jgi:zinc transport system permease protein
MWLAASADTAPGATIVVLAIGMFLLVAVGGAVWRAAHRRTAPSDIEPTVDLGPPEVVLERKPHWLSLRGDRHQWLRGIRARG